MQTNDKILPQSVDLGVGISPDILDAASLPPPKISSVYWDLWLKHLMALRSSPTRMSVREILQSYRAAFTSANSELRQSLPGGVKHKMLDVAQGKRAKKVSFLEATVVEEAIPETVLEEPAGETQAYTPKRGSEERRRNAVDVAELEFEAVVDPNYKKRNNFAILRLTPAAARRCSSQYVATPLQRYRIDPKYREEAGRDAGELLDRGFCLVAQTERTKLALQKYSLAGIEISEKK